MKKTYLYIGALLQLAFANPTMAADYEISICFLQSHTNVDLGFMKPCDQWDSKNNCPANNWISFDLSQGQGQAMYATAMTALVADKKIAVRLDGSSCLHNYDVTTMVRIYKK